jgi:hypothetical protein
MQKCYVLGDCHGLKIKFEGAVFRPQKSVFPNTDSSKDLTRLKRGQAVVIMSRQGNRIRVESLTGDIVEYWQYHGSFVTFLKGKLLYTSGESAWQPAIAFGI